MMKIKILMEIRRDLFLLFFKINLISFVRNRVERVRREWDREVLLQKKIGRIKIGMIVDNQLRGRFRIEDDGSNIENKLVIIFNGGEGYKRVWK